MSHPGAISPRCNRKISRTRRRIRLRTTAVPSAFLMLIPKRPHSSPFLRAKITKFPPERRRPSRYTASNSARRTSRASRGQSFVSLREGSCHSAGAFISSKLLDAAARQFAGSSVVGSLRVDQTRVSACRPFARRRASTFRPFFVFIRARNPCFLCRRRTCG